MKTATYRTNKAKSYVPYTDAATRRALLDKFVDHLLTGAICIACITALLFFMTLA